MELWNRSGLEHTSRQDVRNKNKAEMCTLYSAEVSALRSGLVSHHCRYDM